MNTKIKLWIQIIVGSVGYLVWAIMAYSDPSLRSDFLALNMGMVAGTIGLVLRDMPAVEPTSSRPVASAADPFVVKTKEIS
jgi:hypothetical protein